MDTKETFEKIRAVGDHFVAADSEFARGPFKFFLTPTEFGFSVSYDHDALIEEKFVFDVLDLGEEPATLLERSREMITEKLADRARLEELKEDKNVNEFLTLARKEGSWERENFKHLSFGH